jgi:hypothetical protein
MASFSNNLLAVTLFILAPTLVGQAQTSARLRAKYGEPQMIELRNNHPALERFLVRPNIQMTILYTDLGEPCEALIEPVPDSTPKTGRPEHAPDGDYMSTSEVIAVISEVLPVEKRGKKGNEFFVNGGDREMKLHHPGCTGIYGVEFENASVSAASWCWGGTFSATIHWGKTTCPGQIMKPKTNNAPPNKSLDRSGGSVFRNLNGPAKVE